VNQSFESEAKGFTFTFQPNAHSDSEVEIVEQAKDNNESDEEAGTSMYTPSEATPPLSPPSWAPSTPPYLSSPPPQSEHEPTEPTGSKRDQSLSPELKKVKKKRITSAIKHALELSTKAKDTGQKAKYGLLNFFSKETQEDRKAYLIREDERSNEARMQAIVDAKDMEVRKKMREREMAKERQQKHRQLVKDREIRSGGRSPGGTKRKVSNLWEKKEGSMF
jgi:hypothetical protein